ncbi:MAG TPA: phosphoadenylyl-sulfate reductase [Burkholderiales bacterium]
MALEERIARSITLLREAGELHAPAVFTTSLGVEDMVLADLIARRAPKIAIATLDTGRLPPQTYELLARAERHFKRRIEVFFPEAQAVEQYVRYNGIDGFFESVTQRKACCEVRKVEPLKRALAGKRAWITGMRRDQAATRAGLAEQAWDEDHQLTKFNPLIDWSLEEVWAYVREHGVPYNELHDQGYPSIGCAPCTRAVAPGEDVRAGRWWWEAPEQKECGLHVSASGLLRARKEENTV